MLLDMLRKYAFAGRLQVRVKVNYKQGWACKQYRNKAGMKPQEDYRTMKKWWKTKTEDHPTSVGHNRVL